MHRGVSRYDSGIWLKFSEWWCRRSRVWIVGISDDQKRFNHYAWRMNTENCAWIVQEYYCSDLFVNGPRTFRNNESCDIGEKKNYIDAAIEAD